MGGIKCLDSVYICVKKGLINGIKAGDNLMESQDSKDIKKDENSAEIIVYDNNGELVQNEENCVELKNSAEMAKYLSEGNSLNQDLSIVKSTQQDMKAYLSLYARSQLTRIEKLTNYLDKLEDKMMQDIDSYDPYQFLTAMKSLQSSLANAIDLVKLVGTDERYLNIIYNENNAYINNLQMGNKIDIGLSRESRDKLRSIISQIKIDGGTSSE